MAGTTPAPGVSLTPSDFFVMSRLDGSTSLHTLAQMVGQAEPAVAEALVRLVAAELVTVSGVSQDEAKAVLEAAPAPPVAAASAGGPPRKPATTGGFQRTKTPTETSGMYSIASGEPARKAKDKGHGISLALVPSGWPVPFDQFAFDPVALEAGDALSVEQKQVILYVHYHLRRITYYQLFDVPLDARRSEIKSAYFQLSKAFHPDRWFRKEVGEHGATIEEVFKWINRAYAVLSSPKKRKGYDRLIARGHLGEWEFERSADNPAPSSPAPSPSRASEGKRTADVLVARARAAASAGDWTVAMQRYQGAIALVQSAELHIRLAECMLKAHAEPAEVEVQLVAARNLGGDGKELLFLEAESAMRQENLPRAREKYQAVLEMEPDNPAAKLGLSKVSL
jgi:tetratricopeptide (TPR) repeat protein